VALAPLQAQTVFACAMMDTVVHEECCCGDHQPADGCTDHACDSTLHPTAPCCNQSVELGLDFDAADAVGTVKPTGSDADPPPSLLVSSEILVVPHPSPVPAAFSHRAPADASGSATWLVTRRLRI
jgi:hypothetical protein